MWRLQTGQPTSMDRLTRRRWHAEHIVFVIFILSPVSDSFSTVQNAPSPVYAYRHPYSNEIRTVRRFDTKIITNSSTFHNEPRLNESVVISNKTKVECEFNSLIFNVEQCSKEAFKDCVWCREVRYMEDAFNSIGTFGLPNGINITTEDVISDSERYNSNKPMRNYVMTIDVPKLYMESDNALATARKWVPSIFKLPNIFKLPSIFKPFAGKSSFLTGFGLGFLAFGLKKLLLPLFIGAQIVKSVLIAMFLPSILGGLGKLVGKGVSTFASTSGASGLSGGGTNTVDDFDFKDNAGFDDAAGSESSYSGTFTYPDQPYSNSYQQNTANRVPDLMTGTLPAAALYVPPASATSVLNRYQPQVAAPKISYETPHVTSGNFYTRHKQQDFKVFHQIPTSSLLLTNYDPFYSPLLSRLDSVFQQLGYDTEACRERLVCAMYLNPAKFAPYSNLVSAQLSRELNELRKPSSDNSEILRFFRYMKAAKDGQDGQDCFLQHPGCVTGSTSSTNPPMVKTYNDINKLVHARRLSRAMVSKTDSTHSSDEVSGMEKKGEHLRSVSSRSEQG